MEHELVFVTPPAIQCANRQYFHVVVSLQSAEKSFLGAPPCCVFLVTGACFAGLIQA